MTIKESHAERTANEPRGEAIHIVRLANIVQINATIRVLRLDIPAPSTGIKFLPGQWLDVFVPKTSKPGGFTITSPPSAAISPQHSNHSSPHHQPVKPPYLELAIQKSPENPVAQWFWTSKTNDILGTEIRVRVGGSFVWPPSNPLPRHRQWPPKRVVFVAGGVGVNPLMSMLSSIAEQPESRDVYDVRFLYSLRDPGPGRRRSPGEMLFVERIAELFRDGSVRGKFTLHLTDGTEGRDEVMRGYDEVRIVPEVPGIDVRSARITVGEIEEAVGLYREEAVVYICGLPSMTDEFVRVLTSTKGTGLGEHQVLCEKWW